LEIDIYPNANPYIHFQSRDLTVEIISSCISAKWVCSRENHLSQVPTYPAHHTLAVA